MKQHTVEAPKTADAKRIAIDMPVFFIEADRGESTMRRTVVRATVLGWENRFVQARMVKLHVHSKPEFVMGSDRLFANEARAIAHMLKTLQGEHAEAVDRLRKERATIEKRAKCVFSMGLAIRDARAKEKRSVAVPRLAKAYW